MICVLQFTKVKMNISPGFNFSVCILRTSLCVLIRIKLYDVVSRKKKKVPGCPKFRNTGKVPDFVVFVQIKRHFAGQNIRLMSIHIAIRGSEKMQYPKSCMYPDVNQS